MLVQIGNALNSPSSSKSVMRGVLAFFLIKLWFISFAYLGMAGPRLGDDAYVYMWGAISTPLSGLDASAGISSLENFSSEITAEEIDDENKHAYYRVLLRTVGATSNILHYMFGFFQPEEWSFYALFWLQELFVLCVMTVGVYTLFKRQTSIYGLGLMLPLVALALFPAQGLHFFIPSTLALSFGMIVWGLTANEKSRPILLFLAALLAMLSHKIGIVHASIGGWIVVYFFITKKIAFGRAAQEIGALLAALALFFAVTLILTPENVAVDRLVSYGYNNILSNFVGAANYTFDLTKTDPLALLLIAVGLIAFLRVTENLKLINILLVILVANSVVMSLHFLDGYPGEAMIRVLIPVFFILALLVHTKTSKAAETKNATKLKTDGVLFLLTCLGMAFTNIHYLMGNVETRWAQIDRGKLHKTLDSLKEGSHLLYLEEDIALEASLITGAYENKLSAISLLKAAPDRTEKWLYDNPLTHVVALVPHDFTPRRRWEFPLWAHRTPGFNLRNGGELNLTSKANDLFLKLDSPSDNFSISTDTGSCEVLETSYAKWYKLADGCFSLSESRKHLAIAGDGSIIGISTASPSEKLNWPWGQDITYELKSGSFLGRNYKDIKSSFNWRDLDPDFDESFLRFAAASLEPISDTSGLVFVQLNDVASTSSIAQ